MEFKIVESSSKGNSYILDGKNSALLIECGVTFKKMQRMIGYQIKKIDGCLVTHEHGDHTKFANQFVGRGIKIYGSKGTIDKLNINSPKMIPIENNRVFGVGEFDIMPFDVRHPAEEPFGYLISHPELGKALFAIDTFYIPYRFNDLNHIFVEANYEQAMIDYNVEQGMLHPLVRKRTMSGHMEINTLLDMLRSNDMSSVQEIVLLHLSNMNSNKDSFINQVETATGVPTVVAEKNTVVDLNSF